jgi:hypothetical protein
VAKPRGLSGPEIAVIATTIAVVLVSLVLAPVVGHQAENRCYDYDTGPPSPAPTSAALLLLLSGIAFTLAFGLNGKARRRVWVSSLVALVAAFVAFVVIAALVAVCPH